MPKPQPQPAARPTFEAFIFDLDGTLLNTLPDLVVLTNAALQDFNLPARTSAQVLSYVGDGGRMLIKRAVPTGTPDSVVGAIFERWKQLHPVIGNKLTTPYPGVPEVLAELRGRGLKLGVLSNKFDQGVRDSIGECLPGAFDALQGEDANTPRKPDPTGLERMMRQFGVTPAQTVYLGDSPTDMRCAAAAGVFSIGVSWGYHDACELEQAGADAIVTHASELLTFAR
ncbi:HAD-IA family hydrolase [Eggerthellaceae bacterium zg-887]|uniref:HAD family hydrolase n=1 Tax=Xiamenia xianingshaonis TaxID=2682776 RepID=UPI00140CDD03|nr:HAD family hydrolase [Xiamenia xianingshaonis]NHM17003.1 HAD-IA family hydrolase [Xiamenia xianingshaonis]